MTLPLVDLIELGDPDELVREIDRRCARDDWDGVVEVQTRCDAAVERGKQLWGVAGYAAYRLALDAPGEYAAAALQRDAGPMALGPLPEVAVSTHEWDELVDHLPDGPVLGITAYECVAQGDDLTEVEALQAHRATFELPLRLEPWEPDYPHVHYEADDAHFPRPVLKPIDSQDVAPGAFQEIDDVDALDALRALVQPWRSSSNGTVLVAAVEGGLAEALSALEAAPVEAIRIDPQSALAWMAWAGASGGAYGRRSGTAAGRSKAWWTVAALSGSSEDWPLPADEVGRHLDELEWWTWALDDSSEGWVLRLVIVDPIDAVAFAIDATDAREEDEPAD